MESYILLHSKNGRQTATNIITFCTHNDGHKNPRGLAVSLEIAATQPGVAAISCCKRVIY